MTPLKSLATLIVEQGEIGDFPYVALEHVAGGTGALEPGAELPIRTGGSPGASIARPGDVLFGKLRPYLAKTWLVSSTVYASTELMTLRPTSITEPKYLAYLVSSLPVVEWAMCTADGTKMPRTSWGKLREYNVDVVPPTDQQRAIADYLDAETARIDALITKKQRMIELLEERFDVATATFFLAIAAPHRKLRLVANVALGRQRTPSSSVGPNMVPYLRAANVKDGALDLSDVKSMNFTPEEQRVFGLLPGDVLVTEGAGSRAAVGASAPYNGELEGVVCCQNTLIRLRAKPDVDPGYLAWWIRSAYRNGILAGLAGGANIFHIGAGQMQMLALPIPKLAEQGKIVALLDREGQRFSSSRSKLTRQIELLREHRQALITAAVTGELDIPGVAA